MSEYTPDDIEFEGDKEEADEGPKLARGNSYTSLYEHENGPEVVSTEKSSKGPMIIWTIVLILIALAGGAWFYRSIGGTTGIDFIDSHFGNATTTSTSVQKPLKDRVSALEREVADMKDAMAHYDNNFVIISDVFTKQGFMPENK